MVSQTAPPLLRLTTCAHREKGIGSTTDPGMPPPSADAHKAEMLRLLLVLLSRQIYVPPASLFSQPSRYTLYLVQDMQRRDVLTILCSLLNTALKRGNGTQATSMVNVASKLPYNHLVWKEDSRGNLIGTCFEVLCALLDFQGGAARDVSLGEEGGSSPTTKTNAFRYFLAKLVGSIWIRVELTAAEIALTASYSRLRIHPGRHARYYGRTHGCRQQRSAWRKTNYAICR